MLIADIQHAKATDGLCGMTPEEEYQDYLQRYLSSAGHVQKLCDRYPELVRVTEQVMEQAEEFFAGVFCSALKTITEKLRRRYAQVWSM